MLPFKVSLCLRSDPGRRLRPMSQTQSRVRMDTNKKADSSTGQRVLPGINIKREVDNLLNIDHGVVSNDASTSQTSINRARDNLTLSLGHSLGLVSSPFISQLLQTIRLAAPPTTLGAYELEAGVTWKNAPPDLLPQYYGSSSIENMVQYAQSYLSQVPDGGEHFRSKRWLTPSVESHPYASGNPQPPANVQVEVPSEDLLATLIDGYFERVNILLPILHRPLFESQLRDNLHTQDEDFMRLVLMVCAVGARWCDDPRVLDDQCSSKLSAGHRWFRSAYKDGINAVPTNIMPSLTNVQFMVISVVFILGTSFHDTAWLFAAKVSTTFQALGVHRRKQSHTLADELIKRAFRQEFLLFGGAILYSIVFTTTGKPSAFQNFDIDVDDVMEIEDICWAPELDAPPPPLQGASSQFSALNHTYRLCIIIGQALQTVFAPVDVKAQIGLGSSQGEEWIVRNLNQQLNLWAASIPGNCKVTSPFSIKFDADGCNLRLPTPEHFTERPIPHLYLVVTLWTSYCYAVIYINRPFITSRAPEIAAASFHNCRQAARQCAQMIHTYYNIPTALPLQCSIPGIFSSGMILIIDLIVNSHTDHPGGGTTSHDSEYGAAVNERDLKICSAVLESLGNYCHMAGRLRDIMKEFQEFWRSRLSVQPTAVSKSIQLLQGTGGLESTGLYAQQPSSTSTLAWEQSIGHDPATNFPGPGCLEMGAPSLSLPQAQPDFNPFRIPNELQNFPSDAGLLSEEWMSDMTLGSAAYDLVSLPLEPGQADLPSDWNDTMEGVLRLGGGGFMP
ncbi:unnamed protein product [Rhizoctonia solani]|uniref:Xylanolytic transcriptional activator regulatory domain-containing protein n=1 Tax=Rhizoctonia solani TaxID=456999 RepID=A0A8H3E5M8_9AGAM|nr:unnamed protein product [Rhizoctonia solani]